MSNERIGVGVVLMALGAGLVAFGLWDYSTSSGAVCGASCVSLSPQAGIFALAIPGGFVAALGLAFLLPSRSATGLGLMLIGVALGLYSLLTLLGHWGGVGGGIVDILILLIPALVAVVGGFILWEPRPYRSVAR